MSVWNPDNVRDVAESVGIASLADNIVEELARDVDFRLAQVLEEALKFMRHGKRTTLSTQDVSNALKVLNVEPAAVLCRGRGSRLREADQCAAAKGATRGYIHRYAITAPHCPPYPPLLTI
jgi:histone H3/H4